MLLSELTDISGQSLVPFLVLPTCQLVRWEVPKCAQILALAVDMLAPKVLWLVVDEHVISIGAIGEDVVALALVVGEEVVCLLASTVWVADRHVDVAQRPTLPLLIT